MCVFVSQTLLLTQRFVTFFWPPARQVKVLRPLYGVEVFDGETARFEVELSEDDVHGQWKLNGQVLNPTAVRSPQTSGAPCGGGSWWFLGVRSTFSAAMGAPGRRLKMDRTPPRFPSPDSHFLP